MAYDRWLPLGAWRNLPDRSTPASAEFFEHLELNLEAAAAIADAALAAAGSAVIADGNKGDVTTSGSGSSWIVNASHAGSTHAAVQAAAEATAIQRANHSGFQAIATVTGLQAALDSKHTAGGTDVPVADGGTGSSTAAGARTNLGAVGLTGDETIAGIKTLSSSPIVPTPTTNFQASTKKYPDDLIAALPALAAGTGILVVGATISVSSGVRLLSSGISVYPSAVLNLVNGNNNNVPITADTMYVAGPNAAFSLTGFTGPGGIAPVDGMDIIVINPLAFNMTAEHEDANSTAANRINVVQSGGDAVSVLQGFQRFRYMTVSGLNRWVLVGQGA